MTRTLLASTLTAATLAFSSGAALADRAPTPGEKAAIGDALYAQGYSSWGKIEWDDGRWEVDKAVATDGERYDIKLDKGLTVRESELDD